MISTEPMKRFYRDRSLAGLGVADLVSGGLEGIPQPGMDAEERRRILAGIRRSLSRSEPGSPEPVGSAFDTSGAQSGPLDLDVHLNRERPRRGTAAQ
ncbi:hypothetical protein [Actinoplanes sp. NPDC051494]|uniref:hypothetical protein n=1 Tax=Actinoplanes sp. NPDC051494 TaxID=3363907 RepID=UPI0037932618